MTTIIELRPDKQLLNQHFEKYQFSPDIANISTEINLETEILRLEPNANQSSWLEARLFAFHNHLFANPYDTSFWFVDKSWILWRLNKDGILTKIHVLNNSNDNKIEPSYNASIAFASDKLVVVSEGSLGLKVLVYNASEEFECFNLNNVEAGVILDVRYLENQSTLIVLVCNIIDVQGKKNTRLMLYYYRYDNLESMKNFVFIRKQGMKIPGSVEYVYLEENGDYVHSVCQDNIAFDTDLSDIKEKNESEDDQSSINIPKYCWSQDEENITVWIKIPEKDFKKQLKVNVSRNRISVILRDNVLIQGECQHCLDADLTTWICEEETLKLELVKLEGGLMWSELIRGDTGGEHLPNETLAAEIHSRLAHLCSDQPNTRIDGHPALGFNAEQLEECDVEGKENLLQRINLTTQKVTHLAMLGASNHVLFTCKTCHGQILCLRHDNDACIWLMGQGDHNQWNFEHKYTFPGFGYVEASKSNKKFCIAPTDGSYVAIVEHTKHIFLYERPESHSRVSKQRIIDLGHNATPIMGAAAIKNYLILLTVDKLYRLQIHA